MLQVMAKLGRAGTTPLSCNAAGSLPPVVSEGRRLARALAALEGEGELRGRDQCKYPRQVPTRYLASTTTSAVPSASPRYPRP